ncbi:50S ribosomal protein L6 [Myxococcota bacterium]
MSRIGKKPVEIPKGVSVSLQGARIEVKGPLGALARELPDLVTVEKGEGTVIFTRVDGTRQARANHGLARSLVQNMVIGVSKGYTRVLVIEGVGYRAESEGNVLTFNVGYSKPVRYELPSGIKAELTERGARIALTGIDKETIGRASAQIRAIRPPEPYKGKGIRRLGEHIRRKVGKAGVG